ncbi:MAG: hypothetical protein AVDCRST_MAG89-4512 [uncultured Gemmatimonadetes bacterium]|uniref:Uncharacterized protein n=1 Tax=uncultured Gemmatimonadota bacterium TaxID=203437 RepID=A0A6J4N178_9BACT|nr:MAG: hypothetical protein AVDCRST_MAG89-4512 [uncultured Gemmatimonadota bacterium]
MRVRVSHPARRIYREGSLAQPFAEGIRSIVRGLQEEDRSHNHLNRAAFAIDQMGRLLHGVGYVRDREIADCLTAAVGELAGSHELPEENRRARVTEAIRHLDAALAHAGDGVTP